MRQGRTRRASEDTADAELTAISTITGRKRMRRYMGVHPGFGPDAELNLRAERRWRKIIKGHSRAPRRNWADDFKTGGRNPPAPRSTTGTRTASTTMPTATSRSSAPRAATA